MHRAACGRASALRGRWKCSGRACAVQGRGEVFGGEWVVRSAGNASRSLRACVGAAWGSGSVREGRVAVRGRAKVFGGEWVVRSAGLTHFRRSSSRARVLLYIRPPVHVVKSQPWDRKGVPAFTLPPHRLPRPPRSNRPPAAAVIHNGLSTEKLSTSLLAALCKTFSLSRLRTRIYNISFARRPLPGSVRAAPGKSPRRCATVARAAVRRVGEGEGKGGRPLAQCRTMPLVCRITVRKGGSAQGQPRPRPCVLPAATCLRPRLRPLMGVAPCALPAAAGLPPRPRRLNGHPASADGRENDRMAHRRTAPPTHRTPRGNDTCTIRVP